ncbi:hypothetical protein SLE2022_011180 [Rubroshorea leprosula]
MILFSVLIAESVQKTPFHSSGLQSFLLRFPSVFYEHYLVPGIITGKDDMVLETSVQSFSICRSKDSSEILSTMSHISSKVIY